MIQEVLEKKMVEETEPAITLWHVILIVIGVILAILLTGWSVQHRSWSDPYISEVLAVSADPVRGERIFRQNCATCHGLEASGEVGPNLHRVSERKSRVGLIRQVTSGKTPPMPQFQPNVQDMADLLSFLETL